MSIESESRRLLKCREHLTQCESEYEAQRLLVHNELVNARLGSIEIDGYKIAHVLETTVSAFRIELLRGELLSRGLSEADVLAIIAASKTEMTRDGIIRITQIRRE